MTYGIDVSHHQKPAALPWDRIAHDSNFCIVRATYGAGLRDRECAEHARRARAVGLRVGLYHFFRPSQPVADQLAAFRSAAQAASYRPGDILPALDVEADPIPKMQHVSPSWEPDVRAMAAALSADFGGACLIYITQREFGLLGKPAWLLEHPLWVAHYTGAKKPATPGNRPCLIWQHRVGPYVPNGPGGYDQALPELDQNRAFGNLPIVQRVPWDLGAALPPPTPEPPDASLEALALSNAARAAVDAIREEAKGDLKEP